MYFIYPLVNLPDILLHFSRLYMLHMCITTENKILSSADQETLIKKKLQEVRRYFSRTDTTHIITEGRP
jgi:hypothetical protein